MNSNLTEVVYNQIFPGGMIPLKCKDNISAIDARIQEIEELSRCKVLDSPNRRIPDKEESSRLIPASEIDVTAEGGKSKENETDILHAAPPSLLVAKPMNSEEATIRNSRIVQENVDVRKLKLSDLEGGKGPLRQEQKNKILEMHVAGKSYSEIKQALGIDGRRVAGIITGQKQRDRIAAQKAAQPDATLDPSLPGAEGAQTTARPDEARPATASPKPDPKLDYYEVADAKIINMKKRGMLNHEIAQNLERNPGGSWTTQKVDARWTELKRQGLV
jgi:hypothetical protein